MASNMSKGQTFGSTEEVTNTKLHNLVDAGRVYAMQDADGDTKIQVEESADEVIIRLDTAGTQRAIVDSNGLTLASGASVNELSIDGTLAGNSDVAVPTEKAVKTYVDTNAVSISGNNTFTGNNTFDEAVTLTNGQLVFPATQVPSANANTLDDYEEGTFQIAMVAGTSGTITMNSSFDTMTYVKIGSCVHISGAVNVSTVSSPVGTLRITGLPFTARAGSERSSRSPLQIMWISLGAAAVTTMQAVVFESESQIRVFEQTDTTTTDDAAANIGNGTELWISGWYQSA